MSDEIDDLKHLMDRATPAPDPGVKAAHLALARENDSMIARVLAADESVGIGLLSYPELPPEGMGRSREALIYHGGAHQQEGDHPESDSQPAGSSFLRSHGRVF